MTEEADAIFQQVLEDEGVPTTKEELTELFYSELQAQGSKIANKSKYSPFFLLLNAIVTTPALWLIEFMVKKTLPGVTLKYAQDAFLTIKAWSRKITQKEAGKAEGLITFYRDGTTGDLPVAEGTIVESVPIDDVVYRVITTEAGTIPDGESSVQIPVIAEDVGEAYNLQEGYYCILGSSAPGVTQVKNEEDWLTKPGADIEDPEDMRTRTRDVVLVQSSFHTDAAYRAIISEFTGVDPDNIYFDKTAPRGPFTANAYILLDVGEPSQEFLDSLNYHINDEGNHGHNDDLLCYAMPALDAIVDVEVTPIANLTAEQLTELATDVENVIQAAFRGNSAYSDVTRTQPFSQFSISNLGKDIHREVPNAYSIKFNSPTGDILTDMNIPRLVGGSPIVIVT